jgi:hypothetical protein
MWQKLEVAEIGGQSINNYHISIVSPLQLAEVSKRCAVIDHTH